MAKPECLNLKSELRNLKVFLGFIIITNRSSAVCCPAMDIATNERSIISVGEDGSIFEVALENNQVLSRHLGEPNWTLDYGHEKYII